MSTTIRTVLLDSDDRIPLSAMPLGWTPEGGTQALSVPPGLAVPTWGTSPFAYPVGAAILFAGHVAAASAEIVADIVLVTGGAWPAGKKLTVQSPTGLVLLTSTASTLVVSQILSGGSVPWVSLDGAVIASAG